MKTFLVSFIFISSLLFAQEGVNIIDPVAPIYIDSIAGSKNIIINSLVFPQVKQGYAYITVILNSKLKPINFAIRKIELTDSIGRTKLNYTDEKLLGLLSNKKYLTFNRKYYPKEIRLIYNELKKGLSDLQFYQKVITQMGGTKVITFPINISVETDPILVIKNIEWIVDTTTSLNVKTSKREPFLDVYGYVVFIKLFSDGYYKEIATGIVKCNDSICFNESSCYKEYSGSWIKKNNNIFVTKKLVEQMYCLYEVGKNPDDEYNKIFKDTLTISDKDDFEIFYKKNNYILSRLKLEQHLQSLINYRH